MNIYVGFPKRSTIINFHLIGGASDIIKHISFSIEIAGLSSNNWFVFFY